MKKSISLFLALLASPALADSGRQLDSHEHGVGALNIAIDGDTVFMELQAPGADIVGFEYEAESAQDRASVDAAVATLARPLDLFVFPVAAECTVVEASARLESEEDHENGDDDHGHEEGHDHDEDHAEEHAHGHDDDDHAEHAQEASHTEFHAEYRLNCSNPDALSEITFAYFETFENALEVEVQIVSASGALSFEVERDDPLLDLRGMF